MTHWLSILSYASGRYRDIACFNDTVKLKWRNKYCLLTWKNLVTLKIATKLARPVVYCHRILQFTFAIFKRTFFVIGRPCKSGCFPILLLWNSISIAFPYFFWMIIFRIRTRRFLNLSIAQFITSILLVPLHNIIGVFRIEYAESNRTAKNMFWKNKTPRKKLYSQWTCARTFKTIRKHFKKYVSTHDYLRTLINDEKFGKKNIPIFGLFET